MIISFGWTAAALLAGEKSTTFCEWAPRHVAHFHAGQRVDAWDRGPRAHGHKIGTIQLVGAPEQLQVVDMLPALEQYWASEGFGFYAAHPELRPPTIFGLPTKGVDFGLDWFGSWAAANTTRKFWVVRFDVLDLEGGL